MLWQICKCRELQLTIIQQRMSHSGVVLTADTYRHLFGSESDEVPLQTGYSWSPMQHECSTADFSVGRNDLSH